MAQYPTTLVERVISVPDYIDQAELNERGYSVMWGLDTSLAEQLVVSSKQEHIGKTCENDPTSRFGDLEKVIDWQTKGRLALPLVKKTGEEDLLLAGSGWMGPGEPKKNEPYIDGARITFAVRLYEIALKQGLAPHYTQAILDVHDALYGNNGVWLETWGDNLRAVQAYEQAGFIKVAETIGERRGEKVPRFYMTLGNIATQ